MRAGWFVYAALDLGQCPGALRSCAGGLPPAPEREAAPQVAREDLLAGREGQDGVREGQRFSRAWLGGPVVCVWYLALAIISNLSLLMLVGICHCAVCYVFIAKAEEERKIEKKTALPKVLRSA